MSLLQTQLEHLVNLMAPPFRENWKTYAWAKAVYLAESNHQDYADLPRLLKEAMQPASSSSGDVGTRADSSSADVS